MKVAAVKFKWEKGDRTYDYLIGDDLEIAVGDKAIVSTKRGEAEVEIMALKDESELASAYILRKAEPKPVEPTEDTMDF